MKYFTLLILLHFVQNNCFSQKVMTFNESKENNMRTSELDSIYKSAIHSDTSLAVFKTNEEVFIKAYQQLLFDLGKYLKSQNFEWEKTTKGFNRIYFNQDGNIDYFIYSFRPEQLTAEQEKQFDALLKQFVTTYKFPLTVPCKFAQCSPVTYTPASE